MEQSFKVSGFKVSRSQRCIVGLEAEGIRARDCCFAAFLNKGWATLRADRSRSLRRLAQGRLFAAQRRLAQDDSQLGYPPPPSMYWNVGVRSFFRFDLWATTTYGENLEPVRVSGWIQIAHSGPSVRLLDFSVKVAVNIGGCGKVAQVPHPSPFFRRDRWGI